MTLPRQQRSLARNMTSIVVSIRGAPPQPQNFGQTVTVIVSQRPKTWNHKPTPEAVFQSNGIQIVRNRLSTQEAGWTWKVLTDVSTSSLILGLENGLTGINNGMRLPDLFYLPGMPNMPCTSNETPEQTSTFERWTMYIYVILECRLDRSARANAYGHAMSKPTQPWLV